MPWPLSAWISFFPGTFSFSLTCWLPPIVIPGLSQYLQMIHLQKLQIPALDSPTITALLCNLISLGPLSVIDVTYFPPLLIQFSSIFHYFNNSFAKTLNFQFFIAPTWFYAAESHTAKMSLQVRCRLHKTGATRKSDIKTQLGPHDCSAVHSFSA